MFMNNNAFVHSLTSNTEPGGIEPSNMEPSSIEPSNMEPSSIEPSTARSNNKGKGTTYFCNNNNDNINIENLTININFLNYHFNDNR